MSRFFFAIVVIFTGYMAFWYLPGKEGREYAWAAVKPHLLALIITVLAVSAAAWLALSGTQIRLY